MVRAILRGAVIAVLTSAIFGATSFVAAADSAPDVEWERTYGGIHFEDAWSVAQTNDDGYVLVGQGPSLNTGGTDLYLVKTDVLGELMWEKTFGGASTEVGFSVAQTADGGYIMAGRTRSYGAGVDDVYLVKTNTSGDVEWEKTFGGEYNDVAESVVQTTDDGYIVAGRRGSVGGNDFYLVKTDEWGNLEWEQTFGGPNNDAAKSVIQTSDDGYIIAGYTQSYGAGGNDFYLVKTDPSGNMEWEKTFGGEYDDIAKSVDQATDGGYIVAGYTESYGEGSNDFYLVKTDQYGNMEWQNTFGGSLSDRAESVDQTTDGGYIIAGYTQSYGAGGVDFYLVKTDSVGITEWEKTVGGDYHEQARCAQQTTDGGYIVAGETSSYGAGSYDAYLVKMESEESALPPIADAGGPYVAQMDCGVDLDGSASSDSDGSIVNYEWDLGDNSVDHGVSVSHAYSAVGIYEVTLTVTDNEGAQSSNTTIVVVFDPDSGSATGGGWFWSAEGNLKNDFESEGKATFGFIVRYKHDVADGNLEFQYRSGDINLKDTNITWLTVGQSNAQFKGEGTINGEGLYTFRVLAQDGNHDGNNPDKFTIKIWEGTDTEADPIYCALNAPLGGGNIIIHND
jgi:hypothetical protein